MKNQLKDWSIIAAVGLTAIIMFVGVCVYSATVLDEDYGGTGTDTYTAGDILYSDATDSLAKLPIEDNGDVLTLAAGLPSWAAPTPSGANTALSNIASTQMNADLIWVDGSNRILRPDQSIGNGDDLDISAGRAAASNTGGSLSLFAGDGAGGTGGDLWMGAGNGSTDGDIYLADPTSGYSAILDLATLAASDKTFTFPNVTGILALTNGNVFTGEHDFGGGGIEIENNTAIPGSCTVGQIFMDTDATSGQQLYGCESGSFVQQAGGGGGSTTFPLYPYSAKITGSYVTATIDNLDVATEGCKIDAGEGAWTCFFDDTSDWAAVFYGILPSDYSSTPVCNLIYSMATGTANQVEWECAIQCTTPGDAEDIDVETFAAGASEVVTVPGTAGHTDSLVSITPTDDSCAAGDLIYYYYSTDANDGVNDDATGNRNVKGIYGSFTQ